MIIIKLFSSSAGLKDGKKLNEKPTTERNTWGKIKNSSISNGTISGTTLASSSADTVDRNVTEIAVISPADEEKKARMKLMLKRKMRIKFL